LDHFGIQVDSKEQLNEIRGHAAQAGVAILDEGETTCCYARSDKYWLTDPQGIAWEQFHTLGSIPVFSEGKVEAAGSACCAGDAPRGKPVGVAVKPSSSCC
jgi:lactoylglutathione lyase